MSEDKGFQTEWNQSMAAHQRLDKLFSASHQASYEEDYQSWLIILLNLYKETSQILDEDEDDDILEAIDTAHKYLNKQKTSYAKNKHFTKTEAKIRRALQEHGMMIQQRQELGPAGRS